MNVCREAHTLKTRCATKRRDSSAADRKAACKNELCGSTAVCTVHTMNRMCALNSIQMVGSTYDIYFLSLILGVKGDTSCARVISVVSTVQVFAA